MPVVPEAIRAAALLVAEKLRFANPGDLGDPGDAQPARFPLPKIVRRLT